MVDDRAARAHGSEGDARGTITVPRWVQLAVLPVLLIIAWLLLGIISEAVFIFVVATLLALVLNPFVRGLQRLKVPRPVGVAIVYLLGVGVLAGALVLIIPPVVRQIHALLDALPGMAQQARAGVHGLQGLANRFHLKVDVSKELQNGAKSVASYLLGASHSLLGIGVSVARTVTISVVIAVISIYMLLDAKRIGRFVAEHFPTGSPDDGRQFIAMTQSAVVKYLEAQLLLSAAIGTGTGLTMWVLGMAGVFPSGAKYAVAFGAWAGLMEVIPYLGPVLGAVPPVTVALLHSPITAFWVIIAYVGIQEVEGHIAAPLIMGTRFRVHPLVVIFAVLIGNQLHGIVGMFIAVPLIPLGRETWIFFRARVRFEGWTTGGVGLARIDGEPGVGRGPGEAGPPPDA
jgi:predicted PurR-regulated permease PerM